MSKDQLFSPHRRAYRSKFYKTKQWRRIRQIQLRRAGLCESCLSYGKLTVANTVDHISPLWSDWQGFLKGPFQSLCHSCHNEKSTEDKMMMIRHNKTKQIIKDL